eukprot:TRINITY_DN19728_c0_g1_i1.p1 TRINITY_DN19728_c0_g1~~TRINITY_DN19728_c0_g1_i1.p1  ORF type:complete len:167 (+),score=18.53 TRINITY_DN19728_c0_g1_i1:788-1288(+)
MLTDPGPCYPAIIKPTSPDSLKHFITLLALHGPFSNGCPLGCTQPLQSSSSPCSRQKKSAQLAKNSHHSSKLSALADSTLPFLLSSALPASMAASSNRHASQVLHKLSMPLCCHQELRCHYSRAVTQAVAYQATCNKTAVDVVEDFCNASGVGDHAAGMYHRIRSF